MPWTAAEAHKHNVLAVGRLGVVWAHAANAALAECRAKKGDDCEGYACRVANAAVADARKKGA